MADLTGLVTVLVQNLARIGAGFVAAIDAVVASRPELKDEWDIIRPAFVALSATGDLAPKLQAALVGALVAVTGGSGPIGRPGHGHHA